MVGKFTRHIPTWRVNLPAHMLEWRVNSGMVGKFTRHIPKWRVNLPAQTHVPGKLNRDRFGFRLGMEGALRLFIVGESSPGSPLDKSRSGTKESDARRKEYCCVE